MASASDTPESHPHGALPIGTRLGEFEIRRVIGIGGFGIVYLAFDHLLEREVAVKEYMPASLAGRTATLQVSLLSQSHADTFALGLRSFVNEAKLLAKFDHPSLVKVHRFWEANGTAYMAMTLYRGRTVRDARNALGRPPDEAWLRAVLEPLLGALERMHQEDIYHRDIAPDNILVEADGRPVLLDFGAARRVISDKSQTLTAILKPSYAPIEQYADTGGLRQGPWTDLYALGATLHYLLLGKPPPAAPARAVQDEAPRLAAMSLPGCSPVFLSMVDWMLAPRAGDRPQSVAEVRAVLEGRIVPPGAFDPDRTVSDEPFDPDRTVIRPPSPTTRAITRHEPSSAGSTGMAAAPQPTVRQPAPPAPATQAQARTQAVPPPFTQQPAAAPRPPAAPPQVTRQAPAAALPPPAAEPAGSARPWLVPAVAGVLIAGAAGAWFSLRPRPAAPPLPAPVPIASAPASSAEAVAMPASQPAAAVVSAPAPAAPAEPPASAAAVLAMPAPAPAVAPAPTPVPAPAPAPAPAQEPVPAPPVAAASARVPPKPAPVTRPRPTVEPARVATDKRPPEAPPPATPAPAPAPVPPARPLPAPPPPAVPAPASVPTPAAEAAPVARSPQDRCPTYEPAKSACLAITCLRNEFKPHPICAAVRQEQEERRMREQLR